MRRSAPAAALTLLVAAGLLGARAAPEPAPSPTPTVAETPTPTPTALAVAPGAPPPVVFGGDCALALPVDDLTQATAIGFEAEAGESGGSLGNVGGLNCVWRGDSGTLVMQVIPSQGLAGTAFPAESEKYYFQDCDPDWVCSWRWESADLWIAGTFQSVSGMTRDTVDYWGGLIGDRVEANHAAHPDEPWLRDRTGWWPVIDCADLASAMSAELAVKLSGAAGGYVDPPLPGFVMADAASEHSDCVTMSIGAEAPLLRLTTTAGGAWMPLEGYGPVDVGVPGIEAFLLPGPGPYGGAQYAMTDGVNMLWAEIQAEAPLTDAQVASALARIAASGF